MQEYAADDVHATLVAYAALAALPSFANIVFHWYAFDMVESRPYHIGISSHKVWKTDNGIV